MTCFHTLIRLSGTVLLIWAGLASAWGSPALDALALRARLDCTPEATLTQVEGEVAAARNKGDHHALLQGLIVKSMALNLLAPVQHVAPVQEEALALAKSSGNISAQALLSGGIGERLAREGRYEEALAWFKNAETLAQTKPSDATLALIQTQHGAMLLKTLRRTDESLPLLDAALGYFERMGATHRAAEIHILYGAVFDRLQERERALAERNKALQAADAQACPFFTAALHYEMGVGALAASDVDQAATWLKQSEALYEQLGDAVGAARAELALARTEMQQQNWSAAARMLEHALVGIKYSGDTVAWAQGEANLAVTYAQQYDPRAWQALAAASSTLLPLKQPALSRDYHDAAARTYEAFGKYEDAFHEMVRLRETETTLFEARPSHRQVEQSARYEDERKEAENMRLRLTQALQESTLRTRDAERLALSIGVVTLILALGMGAFALRRQIRLKHRYARLALRDELTGAPNRRAILKYAGRELRRAHAQEHPLLLAIIDLDHFKSINDTCGHDVGDVALKCFYRALTRHLRVLDQLGRFGGEEWLLVMPSAQAEIVGTVFARLQMAARELQVPGIPASRQLTFSMGATVSGAHDDLDAMLKRADEALYRAKTDGRNRIVFSPPPRSEGDETVMNL